jgi:hypothetical protein
MKPARYREAIEWIAENDSAGDDDALDAAVVGYLVTSLLVADLFDVDEDKVGADVVRCREGKRAGAIAARLGIFDRRQLADVCRRAGPYPACDLERLEKAGLVEFARETRSGTTWYRATRLGRAVNKAGLTAPTCSPRQDNY